ncbi:VOC family protein [Amycolatopsis suaedae]|uniref:VOC family protein n=1 Tax=Amycolatopsis suaedae TaxID=2510978 RepID=UPI001F0FD0D7|nr:VOC family protein [Amycolatopsis suaedae]
MLDAGRMTYLIDPTGAPVALWQAKEHIRAEVVNEMDGGPYTVFKAGDTQRQGEGSRWNVSFGVADARAAADEVVRLGGRVLTGPFDTSIGPVGELADPQGVPFGIFQPLG